MGSAGNSHADRFYVFTFKTSLCIYTLCGLFRHDLMLLQFRNLPFQELTIEFSIILFKVEPDVLMLSHILHHCLNLLDNIFPHLHDFRLQTSWK